MSSILCTDISPRRPVYQRRRTFTWLCVYAHVRVYAMCLMERGIYFTIGFAGYDAVLILPGYT